MRDFWHRLDTLEEVPSPRRARAAVLVPFYEDAEGAVRVILTKRPDWMRTHPGDVVFPGGRLEADESIVDAAIREAGEEIGLSADAVQVIGGLPAVSTRDPRNLIVPVVARVARPAEFVLEASEVAAVIEPRMDDLLDDTNWRTSRWLGRTMWFYDFTEGTMWGATAFMMRSLIRHLRAGQSIAPPPPDIEIREMTAADSEHVRRTLRIAASWNATNDGAHIDLGNGALARYHENWGRRGDFGVVAFAGDRFLGGAYGRLFTDGVHGYGYVGSAVPEVAVGVEAPHRGKLLGGRLLRALEDVAAGRGIQQLSVSVQDENRAMRLYDRLGYESVDRNGSAVTMVRSLNR